METSLTLLARAQAQNPDALNQIVELYTDLVYSWCRSAGMRPEDARDVGQEVMLTAISRLNQFSRAEPGASFRKWLRRIARNRTIDWRRSPDRRFDGVGGSSHFGAVSLLPDSNDSNSDDELLPGDASYQIESRSLFVQALTQMKDKVPAETWTLLREVRAMGRPFVEVAAEHGISENAARLRVSHWERKLRRMYDGLLD